MASGIQLNSTNNSEMNIVYQGTSGAARTVVVPDKNMTVAGTDEVIGVNQTWQNVTASRVAGTTYTNTTGKPIQISINIASTQAISGSLTVNGLIIDSQYYNYSSGNNMNLKAIVPNLATYSFIAAGTGLAIGVAELR